MAKKGGKKSKDEPVEVQSDNDSDWDEGSKKPNKKQAEKANKKQTEADKKKEREALLAMEEESIKSEKKVKAKGAAAKKNKRAGNDLDDALNAFGGSSSNKTIDAHGIEDSLSALSLLKSEAVSDKDIDRHPERRFKAALQAYTDRRLPEMKKEQPGLRKQQMEQLIYKEFQKSDENPFNKDTNVTFNAGFDEVKNVKDSVKEKRSKKFEH